MTIESAEMAMIEALWEECSNVGRWGPDDELGTANLISQDKRVAAAALVRTGEVISLGRPLDPVESAINSEPFRLRMLYLGPSPIGAVSEFTLHQHTMAVTHVDAPSHMFFRGESFNGRQADDVVGPDGLSYGSSMAFASGLVTRGVLLDIPASRGTAYLEPREAVTPADLDAAERFAGTAVSAGDAVIVRTGFDALERERGPQPWSPRSGLSPECLRWIHHKQVAVFGGDCVGSIPGPDVMPFPLHQIGLARMGLVLVHALALEELASRRPSPFLFVCAPMQIPGGTGAPANPLAIL